MLFKEGTLKQFLNLKIKNMMEEFFNLIVVLEDNMRKSSKNRAKRQRDGN